jgi:hypothetical protein
MARQFQAVNTYCKCVFSLLADCSGKASAIYRNGKFARRIIAGNAALIGLIRQPAYTLACL